MLQLITPTATNCDKLRQTATKTATNCDNVNLLKKSKITLFCRNVAMLQFKSRYKKGGVNCLINWVKTAYFIA